MAFWNRNKNSNELRVIKTARDKDSINTAAKNGYRPLIKKVEPSDKIRSKYSVIQNKKTGEIEVIGDYRMGFRMDKDSEFVSVIEWTYYYPHNFNSPFAAYLIPKDIKIGERVFIEDLIEDYIGTSWNQGDTYRLESCEAIWNGTELEIQYDPKTNRSDFVG
ncbi:hypothetical protein [Hugenholtzia roseola]|uniref:hypothetical protein n=1 Tax=Hugenholtzia roseola TaxID=1002 RepID=UPI00047DD4BE|nr:hypothetical protein [Hugenholtzia roseola]